MNILFLNLPNRDRIARRYMCTFHSPMFAFPPYELVQLATCIREWNGAAVEVFDAIAVGAGAVKTAAIVKARSPDMVVAILGLETIEEDLAELAQLRRVAPSAVFAGFGHYATIFPREILERGCVDILLLNEPERPLSGYVAAHAAGRSCADVAGLAWRADGEIRASSPERAGDFDSFPIPDFALVDLRLYDELLLGGPYGVIQSARGCPFGCDFCVTSHGSALALKSVDTVMRELESLWRLGARYVRFVDDTFTVKRDRTMELCARIEETRIGVEWTCLARVDTLDGELLRAMKRAGCVRVYVGVESFSQSVLGLLGKRTDAERARAALEEIDAAGLQSVVFLIVGAPGESDEDFELTWRGISRAPVDLLIASTLAPYPGTRLFDRERDRIEFGLFPYVSRFRDAAVRAQAIRREKLLYRRFYLRPRQAWRLMKMAVRFPLSAVGIGIMLLRFMLPGGRRRKREDFI